MSKIFFYVTGYLFSETSLKTDMRKTKLLVIYLGAHRKLIWACFGLTISMESGNYLANQELK